MNKKTEGKIFLITIVVVALICISLTNFDQFQDQIKFIVVLIFGFCPLVIMTLYWMYKKENTGLLEKCHEQKT